MMLRNSPKVKFARARKVVITIGISAAIATSSCRPDDDPEPVGTAQTAIQNATLDDGNAPCPAVALAQPTGSNADGCFPEVVTVRGPKSSDPSKSWRCSGTLIAPRIVLFAHHCLEDAAGPNGSGVATDFEVRFGVVPNNFYARAFHSTEASGISLSPETFGDYPVDFPGDVPDPEEIAKDFVVATLDDPVSRLDAVPRNPAGPNACPSGNFTGTLVATGPSSFSVIDNEEKCGGHDDFMRRFTQTSGWSRSDNSEGRVYDNVWPLVLVGDPCAYGGGAFGDSGGPLLDGQGHLCSVFSLNIPVLLTLPLVGVFWRIEEKHAGVDTTGAQQFFATAAMDVNGNWLGECAKHIQDCDNYGNCAQAEQDVDGDKVWDACDTCPTVYNPEQLTTPNDDPDGDGFGSACDPCPTIVDDGPMVDNCNLEAELAEAFPTVGTQPIIGPPGSGPLALAAFLAAKARYRSLRPNVCDPVACVRQGRESLPLTWETEFEPLLIDCFNNPTQDCHCNSLIFDCFFEHSDDRLRLIPQTSPAGLVSAGQPVAVGQRWCPCEDPLGTSRLGRLQCQQMGCGYDATAYTLNPNWYPISTAGLSESPPAFPNIEHDILTNPLGSTSQTKEMVWDFQQLLPMFFIDELAIPGGNAIVKRSVEGVLMAKILRVAGVTADASHGFPGFPSRAQTFQSGNAHFELKGESIFEGTLHPIPEFWEGMLWQVCPDDYTLSATFFTNPADVGVYEVTRRG